MAGVSILSNNNSETSKIITDTDLKEYLRSRIEESRIGCLEFAITNKCALLGLHTLSEASRFTRTEPERVDTVWTREELCISWIFLNIFPASVRPSARNQLQVFFGNANLVLGGLRVVGGSAWTKRSTSSLVTSAVIEHVISFLTVGLNVLHF